MFFKSLTHKRQENIQQFNFVRNKHNPIKLCNGLNMIYKERDLHSLNEFCKMLNIFFSRD